MTFLVDGTNGGTFPSWTTATRPASPAVGQMGYNTTTGQFDVYNSGGWASIPATAGTVPGSLSFASGTNGITFNNASASVNSKLNDYEEGTWTPNVYHNSTNNATWTQVTGTYRKIGSTVIAWWRVDAGNSGTSGSGLILGGLPFTSASLGSNVSFGVWGANNGSGTGITGNICNINGGTTATLYVGGQQQTYQIGYASGTAIYVANF